MAIYVGGWKQHIDAKNVSVVVVFLKLYFTENISFKELLLGHTYLITLNSLNSYTTISYHKHQKQINIKG